MSEVNLDEVKGALEALKKSVGGTNTTKVESMQGVSGATQVFHTASNSDPGTWAGSTGKDVPSNGTVDGISANGTDYDGVGVMKSIFAKLAKGVALTGVEKAILKAFSEDEKAMDKAFGAEDDKKDDDKDKDDKKNPFAKAKDCEPMDGDDMGKSLGEVATQDATLREGFEISDFLKSFVGAFDKAQANLEARLCKHVDERLSAVYSKQLELTKSLAGAVGAVGDVVTHTATTLASFENQPARGPKAAQNVHVLEKGGFTGNTNGIETMTKAQIANDLSELVMKGQASAKDVLLFESTGQISTALREKISARTSR